MSDQGDVFLDLDKALEPPGEALLEALDRLTPPHYHMQQRDHQDAGIVAQEARVATVGQPDTRMALAMRSLTKLVQAGFIEKVKTEDTVRYRLSALGERTILHKRLRELKKELHERELEAAGFRADAEMLEVELNQTKLALEDARRPFWKRGKLGKAA
jgi:hypothetical protein